MSPASLSDDDAIVIIGAGVLGLTIANLLVTRYPRKHVVIIAAEFPGDANPSPDYASAWAGAHYRPIPASSPQLQIESHLAGRTFEVMKQIAKTDPSAGVALLPAVEYLYNPPEAYRRITDGQPFAGPGDRFRILREDEMIAGASWGCEYETYCINVPIYCSWLLSNFILKGGSVIKQKLRNATAAFDIARQERLGKVSTIVNCSGRNFDTDPKVTYIRGQTCLVRQQYHRTITKQNADGTWFTLIPRPLNGGTIVGVSKEPGDTETAPRNETRERLLRESAELFPDFVSRYEDFDICWDIVGRRPWRDGGTRIEVEMLPDGLGRIVHGYGVGGRGFELSWGIGEQLVNLVNEASDGTMVQSKL